VGRKVGRIVGCLVGLEVRVGKGETRGGNNGVGEAVAIVGKELG
jgi:hypothetical protein